VLEVVVDVVVVLEVLVEVVVEVVELVVVVVDVEEVEVVLVLEDDEVEVLDDVVVCDVEVVEEEVLVEVVVDVFVVEVVLVVVVVVQKSMSGWLVRPMCSASPAAVTGTTMSLISSTSGGSSVSTCASYISSGQSHGLLATFMPSKLWLVVFTNAREGVNCSWHAVTRKTL